MSTETELKPWRYGQTQAERMCADLLALQEFEDIDPQAPLGGGDGEKDILCSKNGIRYVAAAYFPTTDKTYSEIERKFLDDLNGVKTNKRDGFLFFTNQRLTIGEREKLNAEAVKVTRDCQILHVERIRALLDQPSGYGIRLLYLRIPLSPEEQFAYFAHTSGLTERVLERQGRMLGSMNAKLDRLMTAQNIMVQTMALIASDKEISLPPPPSRPDLFLGGLYHATAGLAPFSANISVTSVLALHRAICFDLPQDGVGHLRSQGVYLAISGKPPTQAVAVPPKPEEVPILLGQLIADWMANFAAVTTMEPLEKVKAIAAFHATFLRIHPFLDGNGRVARFLLMQQCLDLFGVADMGVFDKGAEYFAALKNADNDDLTFLVQLIEPVVGIEAHDEDK